MADELFAQADLNKDQRIDLNEFRNFIAQNLGHESANFVVNTTGGVSPYAAGTYGLSSSATYGDVGNVAQLTGANIHAAGAAGGEASYSSYEQSSYASSSGVDAGAFDANTLSGFGIGGFETNASSGIDLTTQAAGVSSTSTFETSSSQQQVRVDPNNPQNLYRDPNPQVVRRPAQGGQLTYTQHVKIRFLQPPPVPPPGPLIIKEVRPPQPPPPPPLRVRQQAPPLPQPPPLILRERPPVPPVSAASQTVIRRLAAIPAPPRSVIIERLPPLPPKPRDIIIERWIPYGALAKRKTIVQRAAAAKAYPKPRNIIIQYEPVQARVVRQFQRLGVTPENPQAYIQRYGISLLDAQALVQQARAAGVIEDISPPNNVANNVASSSTFSAEFNSASSGIETTGGAGLTTDASASSFESSSYSGGAAGAGAGQQGSTTFSGFESAQGAGLGGGFLSSSYESSSFSSQGGGAVATTFGGAEIGGANASGYESYGTSVGGLYRSNTDPAIAAFDAADLNKDGTLDPNEFRQFLSSHLQYW